MKDAAPRRVEKPWGHEVIWAETDRYIGKIITIEPGHRLSLQYHERKDESLIVTQGTLRLHLENENGEVEIHDLEPGQRSRIPVGRRHRFDAVATRVELCEVSTPEIDDGVRLEDDYAREGTSEA